MLNNLANLFSARFGQTSLIEDVDDAIKLHREALEQAPIPHPNRSVTLNNLGSVLLARCSKTDFADVDEAIAMHQEAVGLLPAAHPHRPASLYNLAIALSARFDHAGQIKDIDKAITTSREALSLAPCTSSLSISYT
jgi:tetratricopeptide (TPR) repeat protein